jgi:hypothetical protein
MGYRLMMPTCATSKQVAQIGGASGAFDPAFCSLRHLRHLHQINK